MRLLGILTIVILTLSSCFEPNYQLEDLYGKWTSENMGFTFNKDNSCEIIINGNKWPGETEFRPVSIGNTLEFTANGSVIMSNVTIKSLKDDVLTIEMRPMTNSKDQTTEIHVLNRVAE